MNKRLVFAIPGDIETATGGYAYDRRMIAELSALGWDVEVLALPASFPAPSEGDLDATRLAFSELADGTLVLIDGLAFGAMPEIAEAEAERLRLAALVHHPLALETGLDAATSARLRESETAALAFARLVVATSETTGRELIADFAVPERRLRVVPPGTERAPLAPGGGRPPVVLAVGSLTPRKGYDVLVDALTEIADLDWRCRIVGSPDRNPVFAAAVTATIERRGLSGRITLLGEAVDPRAEMARADLFALATRHEGYGMVFAEAMTQGLPIVSCAAGAVPEVVPDEAGILVPPGDARAFADALRRLLSDEALLRSKADGAKAAGADLPDWSRSARRLSAALEEINA